MNIAGTIDSDKFWIFIKFFESIIKAEQEDPLKTPTFIVDNARIHTSRLTKEVAFKLIFKIRFFALYCTEIAPIEQALGIIKSKIRSQGVPRIIDFDKDEEIRVVLNLLASISHASCEKMWIKVVKEAKLTLVEMKRDTNKRIWEDAENWNHI